MEGHRPGLRWQAWEQTVHPTQKGQFPPPTWVPGYVSAPHTVHTVRSDTKPFTYIHVCPERPLQPAFRLQAVPCIQTPREITSHQHPYTQTRSQHPTHTIIQRTCEHMYTLTLALTDIVTCVHNATIHNQHIYTHAFTHVCLFRHTYVQPQPHEQLCAE